MKEKQRVFIYDRKEMGALILLGLMVAVFAFTLGVHLGKRVGGKNVAHTEAGEATPVETHSDKEPESKEIADQAKSAGQVADDSANQALHDEVERTGLKLDKGRQVDLPKSAKSDNAGATTIKASQTIAAPHAAGKPTAEPRAASRFTLQVGSYPILAEAKLRAKAIEELGLHPQVQQAEIRGKGKWYRVYVGEFPTKVEAEKAGNHYRAQRLIDSFVVAKSISAVSQ
jgi:cell division protein FtsN